MGIVNKYGSAARDPSLTPPKLLPAQVTQGHVKLLVSTVEIANGDSATSTVEFGSIASSSVICLTSALECDAITSLTDFDLGIGQYVDGAFVMKDADCLIDGADLHTAASKALTGINIDSRHKRVWEIAGYTSDPGRDLVIVGTLKTDSGAAGTITLSLFRATE